MIFQKSWLWMFLMAAALPTIAYGADPSDALFARSRYFNARSELNHLHIRLEREFVQSGAWTTAQSNLITAGSQLQSLRQPLVDAVRNTPAYQRIWQRKYALEKQLESAYAKPNSAEREADIYRLANQLLDLRQELTRMEADALAAEPAVHQAKQDLVSANQQLRDLWDQHARSISANPSWQRAHRRMESAYAQWIDAAGRWQGANDRDWASNRQRLVSIGNLDGGR
ncbi:MAG: hypothetical protein IT447_08275 [Phycisphaerales bacterium]|nr:hypothetical protein [Phycisphaerales bacterium]